MASGEITRLKEMRDLLLLAAVLVASTTSFAQQAVSGALNSRTMDRTKSPLPGVTVTATGAVRRQVVTSLDGEYGIADLPPGRYTVTAELVGFLTYHEWDDAYRMPVRMAV